MTTSELDKTPIIGFDLALATIKPAGALDWKRIKGRDIRFNIEKWCAVHNIEE